MLNILKNITRLDSLKEQKLPKHIAISTRSLKLYKKKDSDIIVLATNKIMNFIEWQFKLNIPILTIKISTHCDEDIKFVNNLFSKLNDDNKELKARIMIIGQWFNLPQELTEKAKILMEKTKDYDQFFINFLIKYSGKEELVSAIKLLTIKAKDDKIDANKIGAEVIKESLYTSYFIPPDLIIECGYKYSGILLWDSFGASIYFKGSKHWLDFDRTDFNEALSIYKKELDMNLEDNI